MPHVPDVTLVPIDALNWRAVLAITVTDDQLPFVADHQPVALVILAKAYLGLGGRRWTPLAIVLDHDKLVGVAALADRNDTAELFHLAVDHRHQRRGIATQALRSIIDFADTVLGCSELELTVHPDNQPAQRLYTAAGFAPTGEHRDGEPVWRRSSIETYEPPDRS